MAAQTNGPLLPDLRRLALPVQEGWTFLPLEDIRYLSADGNYSRIHLGTGRDVIVTRTLSALEQQFRPNDLFLRIHRSYLVNLEYLRHYHRSRQGVVVLDDGTRLPVAAGRRAVFEELLLQLFRY